MPSLTQHSEKRNPRGSRVVEGGGAEKSNRDRSRPKFTISDFARSLMSALHCPYPRPRQPALTLINNRTAQASSASKPVKRSAQKS